MSFIDPGIGQTPPIATQAWGSRTASGMPMNPWRGKLQPASFRGARFYTDVDGQAGGRRLALHEFPKRDVPLLEDMGRKAQKHFFVGYVIANINNGFDQTGDRKRLVAALDQRGPGQIVHPLLGVASVICDTYSVTDDQRRGGVTQFEMSFIEAGSVQGMTSDQTDQGVTSAAGNSETQTGNELNNNVPTNGKTTTTTPPPPPTGTISV
jgi:prophage DNA circulation protein